MVPNVEIGNNCTGIENMGKVNKFINLRGKLPMDDFKRYNTDYITAWDLNCKYISYRHETRREFMRIANRLARKRLKRELSNTLLTLSNTGEC